MSTRQKEAEFVFACEEVAASLEPGQYFILMHPLDYDAPTLTAYRNPDDQKWQCSIRPADRDDVVVLDLPAEFELLTWGWQPVNGCWAIDLPDAEYVGVCLTVTAKILFPVMPPERFDFAAGNTRRGAAMPDTRPLSDYLSRKH